MKWVAFVLLILYCVSHAQSGSHVQPAAPCTDDIRQRNCSLPTCRCSGPDIPGGLRASDTPQLVLLTFDDAVTWANFPLYKELLSPSRLNPNGYPITATFFVNHEYTNYSMVHELYSLGHEIALHSITHRGPTTFWATPSEDLWHGEVVQQREQMSQFARIPQTEIRGVRAPFLQIGGDPMYSTLNKAGFLWDCSRATLDYRKPGLWPYTNDFRSTQECQVKPCPVGKYPGFWTVPMVSLVGDDGEECSMVDMCTPLPNTKEKTFNMLLRNFKDHYEGNRAPFGLFAHSAWLDASWNEEIVQRKNGYFQFLDYLQGLDDVYFVSVSRALEWVRKPTPVQKMKDFLPFQVTKKDSMCGKSLSCRFGPEQTPFQTDSERWMHSCAPTCPSIYPWVGNPLGRL